MLCKTKIDNPTGNGGIKLSAENVGYITGVPGFSPQIGHLVSMMNYVRFGTIQIVKNLSVEELDYIHDSKSNSIGALLLHMAAIETAQQLWSFENRAMNESELQKWASAFRLGDNARTEIVGLTANGYLECLNEVRQKTYHEFTRRDDSWLYEVIPSKPTNQYCRWFHVLEDEMSHRGQIKWILGRLRKSDLVPRSG